MEIHEKLEKVNSILESLGVKNFKLEYTRDDEISADYIWASNVRGPGGYIVGDDGSMLFCQSIKPYLFCKQELK